MGKAGEKQKQTPKIKDKRQSERFKEAARELGANENGDVFDQVLREMATPSRLDKKKSQDRGGGGTD